jgi:hypothetical protein
MAKPLATRLEAGDGPGLGARREPGRTGHIAPARRSTENLEHLGGVVFPISREMKDPTVAEFGPQGRDERRLHQTPLLVALLRPWIGKEQHHQIE